MVVLAAQNISLRLGGRPVLQNVSLEVKPGELVAILGPNGAGKSTLLNVLSGEQAVDSGDVALGGKPLRSFAPRDLARARALMPQKPSLSFPFKVRDVVEMGRDPFRRHGCPIENENAVDWALGEADIRHLERRTYTQLSGGEQQRVQLARVLAQIWTPEATEQRFLMLDEPTSSLDLSHQHGVLHLARSLAARATGIVAVVHDLNLAALYATRVVVIAHGKLVANGTPNEVLTAHMIASVFGLSAHLVPDPASGRRLIVPTGHHPAM